MRKPSVSTVAMAAALAAMAVGIALTGNACPRPPDPTAPSLTLPSSTPQQATLLFVGDLSTARDVAATIDDEGKGDPRFMFERVRPLLESHDLVFANLECVVSDSDAGEATQKVTRIRSLVKHASTLKEVGVDVVSVANNHAMDFGKLGFVSTLAELDRQGVVAVGAIRHLGPYQAVEIVDVGGFKVGFLAYNQHTDEYRHAPWRPTASGYSAFRLERDIKAARPLVDYLVVSVHGGRELSHDAIAWQREDAARALDAGADAWVGHHPHVVQPYELRPDGKVIAYSLGDFLFDKASPWLVERNRPRLFLSVTLQRENGVVRARPRLIAGDQETATFRPLVDDAAFDVASFDDNAAAPAGFALRDLLPQATVVRVTDAGARHCDRWEEKRALAPKHAFRWLAPRWGCGTDAGDDARKAWLSVAPTAELFSRKMKRGVWAHPHKGGPLRITFSNIPPARRLVGYAGVTDWGVELDRQARAAGGAGLPPVELRVTLPGTAVDVRVSVPADVAAVPVVVDVPAGAVDVVVEVSGGTGDDEGRFVFDLQGEP